MTPVDMKTLHEGMLKKGEGISLKSLDFVPR